MKPLQEIFPRASKSFLDANSLSLPSPATKDAKNGIRRRSKGHHKKWPNEEYDYEANDHGQIPNTEPKRHQAPALDSANAGETQGFRRTRVRFTLHRVRCLDPDNAAASCKDLLDGLQYAGLILGDEPWRIIFQVEQEKVKSYKDERTVIEIETSTNLSGGVESRHARDSAKSEVFRSGFPPSSIQPTDYPSDSGNSAPPAQKLHLSPKA